MIAEIISIGTEILLGEIVNTNAKYISENLALMGIQVHNQTVVGDNEERIKKALDIAFSRADMVITTGGLGPTCDDISKETIASYMNRKLVIDEIVYENLELYLKKNKRKMTDDMKKQAYVPTDSIILYNKNGSAPGGVIEEDGKVAIFMPGPPVEMKSMFEEVREYLQRHKDGIIMSKRINIAGLGESKAAEMVDDLMDSVNPTLAPYAANGCASLRISAKAESEDHAKRMIDDMEVKIKERLGDNVFGSDDEGLEEVVARILVEKKMTIATAESCTGGMIASNLINYPGISEVFMEGIVAYSNRAKIRDLCVDENTLNEKGAVSAEVAEQMARGAAMRNRVKIGISSTGIAGPDGGSDEKPVGLVYIGLYIDGKSSHKRLNLMGDRQRIREYATIKALDLLRRELIK